MRTNNKSQSGQAALFSVLLLAAASLAIGAGFFALALREQQSSRTFVRSLQTYAAAESGVEDALLRLKFGMDWQSELSLAVGNAVANTVISNPIGGSQTILSAGDLGQVVRKSQATVVVSSDAPLFSYGALVGNGGLRMDNSSRVIGNVFSNGSVVGSSGAAIEGSLEVANAGNEMEEIHVTGDAYADRCEEAEVGGVLHVNTNSNCEFGSAEALGTPAAAVQLPITDEWIQEKKNEAVAGGTTGSYTGSSAVSFGPRKIQGNLTIQNQGQLTLTGTLWVTGNVVVQNSSRVQLASSYGTTSGFIIADGSIMLQNSSISQGSGQAGSYLMYLSTSSSGSAVTIRNDATADVLYASQGTVVIENNARLREVTGNRVHLKNNATLTYETGIQNIIAGQNPVSSLKLIRWKEAE